MIENSIHKINNLFLIGAGLTRAMIPEAPLNDELLGKMICSNPNTLLKKYQDKYNGIKDIEILLTRLDLEIAQNSSEKEQLQKDRKIIDGDIAEYFEQFRFKEQSLPTNKWLETLAKQLFKDEDAIITTNYDCFLEGLLDYYKVWHPTEGYVNAYDPRKKSNLPETEENPKGIKFYKIHGSENFRECKVFEKGPTEQTILGFVVHKSIYPVSGKNTNVGWAEEFCKEYIVAPSFVKIPHFQIADMVNEAKDVAKTAQNMVIIGLSLRNGDIFLRLILTSFINYTRQNKKRLIIVDPESCPILEKIKIFCVGNIEHINFISISQKMEEGLVDLIKLLERV
jgi:hypothetical protein